MADDPIPVGSPAADAVAALVDIVRTANSPELWQAQQILLRRLALQGDVIPSRVPAPRNITEIGGYMNLLGKLGQPEMRSQALAGILGVAGPNPPLGWVGAAPVLSMVTLPNDRPEGPSQSLIPLTVAVRSDFGPALQQSLAALHAQGGTLPLMSAPASLPQALPGAVAPDDALPFLGRVLNIVPGAARNDPAVDPIVLARAQGTTDPFVPMSRVLAPGTVPVTPANWDALQCDATSCTPVSAASAQYVPIAPLLAAGGFYPAAPPSQPSSIVDNAWSRFTNVTGLVAGSTKLGDELNLLYDPGLVNGSVFVSRLEWVWNGTTFNPTT